MSNAIILFDGVCNLCNSSVQFVLKRDAVGHFQFAALQSEAGKAVLARIGVTDKLPDSIVLVNEQGELFVESDAAIRIAMHLGGFWPVLRMFLLLPKPLRNAVYRFIARNRYRWFGKTDECMLPRPEWKNRFLTDLPTFTRH